MCEQLILYLDEAPSIGCTSYQETLDWLKENPFMVPTTQTHFLQFKYAKRLFVRVNGEIHEITLGKCEGTDREIRPAHNIEMMLLNGAFDYYR